jgi:osmotically-inducible protein OsmY
LHKVAHKTTSKLLAASGGPKGRLDSTFNSVRGSLSETSLDSRVALRLAWERSLTESEIEVELVSPGVVRLTGQVHEPAQRQRAYDIAHGTAGVHQVVNDLGVGQ